MFALSALCGAQISPGPLSKAHASLSGATNCTSCHKLGGGERVFTCLQCHTEIASRISAGRGFHAGVVKKESGSQNCSTCHSEHNGENFQLIRWEPSQQKFDHSRTGWALQGKHAEIACVKCHTSSRLSPADKLSIQMKDLSRTFLGQSRECTFCHADQHQSRLGKQCQQCHNSSDWKMATDFDHSKTKFTLTGAHEKIACDKCHVAGSDGKRRWTGLPVDCASCHRDPHRGSFQSTCQSCHNTSAWKSVSQAVLSSRFDHAKTRFPLLGKHEGLDCAKCHVNGNFKQELIFQTCSDCHLDAHNGQFTERADKGECASCHTVNGFTPTTFTVAEHEKTAYKLQGKHVDVLCAKCHVPAGKATLYRLKFERCTTCHQDAHAGQFQGPPNQNRCENCHTVNGFHPSTFTLAKHSTTRYRLSGAHVAIPCEECHKPGRSPLYPNSAAFRFGSFECTTCHEDPHRGQFQDRMAKADSHGAPLGCQACHTLETWKDVTKFDHASTKFQLQGAHRAVACIDCHRPANMDVKLMQANFKSAPTRCEECHAEAHGGQFANARKVTECASCHNTNKWKPSIFDHNTRTQFKLEGVHANVRCARCHTLIKESDGKDVLFYKPTPRECAACHGANAKGL